MSFRTVTYKALCAARQLASFYPDLCDPEVEAWSVLFHQRYSTNTSPTWERAQPFQMLGHNGEINTIRGNVALMRGREGRLGSEGHLPVLRGPAAAGGRIHRSSTRRWSCSYAAAARSSTPPECSSPSLGEFGLAPQTRAFFDYHACLIEPWDGPARYRLSESGTRCRSPREWVPALAS